MFPLWIIDLTDQGDRQTHFRELVGRLPGVLQEEQAQDWYEEEDHDKRQWLYTRYDNNFKGIDPNDAEQMSQCIYDFQETIVRKGQAFIQMLRHSNIDGTETLNICVLGDATQRFTQLVFPSIAVM
ncbi:MAG: hypothetical protein IKZ67_00710, partial [Paludibacteraceae bacterium]|nr:hypothetical protein [Paludibacteraceae bacterium]